MDNIGNRGSPPVTGQWMNLLQFNTRSCLLVTATWWPFSFIVRPHGSNQDKDKDKGSGPIPNFLFFIKFINSLWPPPCFIKLCCEFFFDFFWTFSPLNIIPWYPKQILLHCEEAEKFIFDMPQKTFSMPISCCQSPPEYIKIHNINFYKREWPPPPLL